MHRPAPPPQPPHTSATPPPASSRGWPPPPTAPPPPTPPRPPGQSPQTRAPAPRAPPTAAGSRPPSLPPDHPRQPREHIAAQHGVSAQPNPSAQQRDERHHISLKPQVHRHLVDAANTATRPLSDQGLPAVVGLWPQCTAGRKPGRKQSPIGLSSAYNLRNSRPKPLGEKHDRTRPA